MAVSGHNWGSASVEAGTLTFLVGGKMAMRMPLKDVAQVGREVVWG
jgi:hypothetical protein